MRPGFAVAKGSSRPTLWQLMNRSRLTVRVFAFVAKPAPGESWRRTCYRAPQPRHRRRCVSRDLLQPPDILACMLSTLIELQRLKRLDRTGWTLRGLPNGTESVAAHSFGVVVAAMLLADELLAQGVSVDMEKVLRMALLHDWAEVRVGDMPRI